MKQLLFASLLFFLAACQQGPAPVITPDGQEISSPVAYNDYFIALQADIMRKMTQFSESLESFETESIQKEHKQLVATIDANIAKAKATPPYDDDQVLKPAFVELFSFYHSISTSEYGTIKNLIEGGEESISDDDLRVIDSLTKSIALQETKMKTNFDKAQSRFAEKYSLKVEKPKPVQE